jgi:AraC family transcriptional regulator, regulatory protein of adaptative response / methylated-DNA-[protein]-cysteine methyltransferase
MTPQISQTSQPETLRFGYGDTALGSIVVAESTHVAVALFIGDDCARLLRDLKDAFPEAEILLDQISLAPVIAQAAALVESPHLQTDMRLDLRGSPLEIAVWQALQTIPPGETRSYGTIAKGLSITATAQEIGAACGANRIAIAVPCHRVVKSNSSIAGYRWGVWRKRRLIKMEGVAQCRSATQAVPT